MPALERVQKVGHSHLHGKEEVAVLTSEKVPDERYSHSRGVKEVAGPLESVLQLHNDGQSRIVSGEGFAEGFFSRLGVCGVRRVREGMCLQQGDSWLGNSVCGRRRWRRKLAEGGYLRGGVPASGGMELDEGMVCETVNFEAQDPLTSGCGWSLSAAEVARAPDAARCTAALGQLLGPARFFSSLAASCEPVSPGCRSRKARKISGDGVAVVGMGPASAVLADGLAVRAAGVSGSTLARDCAVGDGARARHGAAANLCSSAPLAANLLSVGVDGFLQAKGSLEAAAVPISVCGSRSVPGRVGGAPVGETVRASQPNGACGQRCFHSVSQIDVGGRHVALKAICALEQLILSSWHRNFVLLPSLRTCAVFLVLIVFWCAGCTRSIPGTTQRSALVAVEGDRVQAAQAVVGAGERGGVMRPFKCIGAWTRSWNEARLDTAAHSKCAAFAFQRRVAFLTASIVEGALHRQPWPLRRLLSLVTEWETDGRFRGRRDNAVEVAQFQVPGNDTPCRRARDPLLPVDGVCPHFSAVNAMHTWEPLPQLDGVSDSDSSFELSPWAERELDASCMHAREVLLSADDVCAPPSAVDTLRAWEPLPQMDGALDVESSSGLPSHSVAAGVLPQPVAPRPERPVPWEQVVSRLGDSFSAFLKAVRDNTRNAAVRLAETHAAAVAYMNRWDLLLLQRELAGQRCVASLQRAPSVEPCARRARHADLRAKDVAWLQVARSRRSLADHFGISQESVRSLQLHLRANLDVDTCLATWSSQEVLAPPGALGPACNWKFHGLFERALRALPSHHDIFGALHCPCKGSRELGTEKVWFADSRRVPGSVTCTRLPSVQAPRSLGASVWHQGTVILMIQGSEDECGSVAHEDLTRAKVSNFLPPEFRWTDTHKRHKSVDCHCGSRLCPREDAPDWGSGLKIKGFDHTGVVACRREWLHGRRIRCIDTACRTILEGKFHFPTVPGGIRHCARRNLGSVDLDKPRLHKLVCKYLIAGSLEYCPPGHRPDNYIPLGLVPKNDEDEPWRVIADGRGMNADLLPWLSTMHGMKASAGLFQPGSFCFLKDFSSAYHNVPLGTACAGECVGCPACRIGPSPLSERCSSRGSTQEVSSAAILPPTLKRARADTEQAECAVVTTGQQSLQHSRPGRCTLAESGLQSLLGDMRPLPTDFGQPGRWARRKFVGCKPGVNCKGVGCQKQAFGIELDGVHCRFAVCHFGIRTSGNAWSALIAPLIREWRDSGARIILWVDDICVIVPSDCPDPSTCGGPDSCRYCADCKARTERLDKKFTEDIRALGFETNRKDLPATTSAVFLGLGFDTVSMTFWVDPQKAAAFRGRCAELIQGQSASRRQIAELVGKLAWWEPAISNAKLMSRSLQALTCGKEEVGKWDEVVAFTPAALRELCFWRDNVVPLAEQRMPMLVPKLPQLRTMWAQALLAPREPAWVRAHLATDGGPIHWGAVFTHQDGSRLSASGEYPIAARDSGLTAHQAWREGFAALLGLQSFSSEIRTLRGGAILHDSDCQCVVKAFTEGTVRSEVLQSQAVSMWECAASLGVVLFSGWVPGTDIIRSGADALSRDEGLDWHGWGISARSFQRVRDLQAALGWTLTVDLFASDANAKCTRFYARRHCPGVEAVDAFGVASWGRRLCACGHVHRETVYVCPPEPVLLPTWLKLMRDKARGVAVVPKLVGAPWWSLLRESEVRRQGCITFHTIKGRDLDLPAGCGSLNKNGRLSDKPYVIVAFDFDPKASDDVACSPCKQATMLHECPAPVTEVSRGELMAILAAAVRAPPQL